MGREGFKSNLGSILALAGSAVGLGNIWRFPYMLGEYGGGAFLLIYVFCIIVVTLPIMLSEFIVGRRGNRGAFSAIYHIEPRGPWKFYGSLAVFIPFATLCYYCVIGGWTLYYLLQSCLLKFSSSGSSQAIDAMFDNFTTQPLAPVVFHGLFLLATAIIIKWGVRNGIEKCSKIMMPLLFFVMLLIAVRSMTLPGAAKGIGFIFNPDFSKITPQVFLAAMGQAFYSLSVGMGIMITYASYLDHDANLPRIASCTIFSDFLFALIAGCAIIPVLFAFGMPTGQGTGLVFKTLPLVFSQLPLGSVIAAVFFFAVLLAALTSAMSLFEVPVSWLMEHKHTSRNRACLYVFIVALVVGAVCSLSFGPLSHVTVAGKIIFEMFDYTIGNYLMPFAGLVVVLFVGWKMHKSDVSEEIFLSSTSTLNPKQAFWFKVLVFAIKYIAPLAILAIFLSGII
ncbi:MAG: sodium-dependent transporter [Bacteroidales bacterium]|nr:sodium-dependent transporter [Bacteroidales bacterium]